MERKVLFTASSYSHICNFHLPYLKAFQEKGWTVHVACGGEKVNILYADAVIHLPFEKKMSALNNFRASAMLRRLIKREGYTLVTTHTSLAAFFTRFAMLGMEERPKVVNMAHGYLFSEGTPALKKQILLGAERLTAPVTDLLLTMNRWDHEVACRYQLGKRIANIPGIGVNFSRMDGVTKEDEAGLRQELRIPVDAFVLFYAAEFSDRKSQSVLIRAMQLLPEYVYLVLAGSGSGYEECQQLARDLCLENRIVFPGYVTDVPRWYAMADAAVTASRSEGLPFNVMEAMYAGLPVVASNVKGHEDLIRNEETGLLYPYGDHEVCERQVSRLLGSPLLKEKLSQQARENVMQFSLTRVLPIVMEEYGSLFAHPDSCMQSMAD